MKKRSGSAFKAIRAIDYTVIFVRDMAAMRRFYEDILGFPLLRELSPGWIEYQIGGNTLALARPSRTAADAPTPWRGGKDGRECHHGAPNSNRPCPASREAPLRNQPMIHTLAHELIFDDGNN